MVGGKELPIRWWNTEEQGSIIQLSKETEVLNEGEGEGEGEGRSR